MNTPDQSGREKDIFEQALDLPSPERGPFLASACGGDAGLLARVQTLLRAHEAPGGFLADNPAAANATVSHALAEVAEKPGSVIGRYKLLQELGEGGCGIVYMAEQEVPVRRRVALKVIKLGMDTKAVIARFEAERQALAMMDHPNIAKVLDAGATDTGRPYFVMELVRGLPITTYCDQHNLPMLDRLNLFTQVCHAIQHAHQKGIIHRDIKPSNILVTLHDGVPVPKVIDFGIAKATLGRLTDQTVFTAFEQFIGTPAYMSPEQAEMSGLDIDTRSDIYSLGVLLYELLTGKPPFDPQALMKAGLDEIRRLIREVEPPKPSTRLSTLTAADSTTLAKLRGTDAAKLSVLIRGDLDWIVMKALEKNRTRRYETAGAFAADIQRHLHNEPVTARPPSAGYLLQKLISRNRLAFAAAAAIATALVIGLGIATWAFVREKAAREQAVTARNNEATQRQQAELARERAVTAEAEQSKARQQAEAARNEEARQRALAENSRNAEARQRTLAEEARNNEAKQRAAAEEARASEATQRLAAEANEKKAKTEAARSEQAYKFMAGMLQGVGPSVAAGRDTTLLREILDKTIKRLDKTMKDQPEVDANLRAMLGSVFLDLGDAVKAEAMVTDALAKSEKLHGREHADVAEALNALGLVRIIQGKCPEAETLLREALAILTKLPGEHEQGRKEALFALSLAQFKQGMLVEAEADLRQALVFARQEPDGENSGVDNILMLLGNVLVAEGRLAEAEPMIREALAALRQNQGNENPSVGSALISLSNVLQSQGKPAESAAVFGEGLAILKKIYGPEHPNVVRLLVSQALIIRNQNKLPETEALLREALAGQRKVLGPEHDEVATTLQLLAQVLQQEGKPAEVEALQREAMAIRKKVLGSPEMAEASMKMGQGLNAMQQGKWADAEAAIRVAVATAEKKVGSANPEIIQARMMLAEAVFQQSPSRCAEAEVILREALAASRQAFGNNSTFVANALLFLARACEAQDKIAETESSLREMLAISKTFTTDGENANVADALLLLAAIRARLGDSAEASALVKTAAPISHKLPENQQERGLGAADAMSGKLRQQGKTAEAEAVERVMFDFVNQRDGPNSRAYEQVIVHLASSLNGTGNFTEAETLAREGWTLRRKLRPATDWTVANAQSVYGQSLLGVKKYAEAETALLASFADMQKNRPNGSPGAIRSYIARLRTVAGSIVKLYEETNQPAKIDEWKRQIAALTGPAATGAVVTVKPGEPDLAALSAQETELRQQGKFTEAAVVERQLIELVIKRDGRESATTAAQIIRLAQTLNQDTKYAEAEPFAREGLTLREQILPTGHWQIAHSRGILGTSLLGQKKFAEAEPILLQAYADLQQVEASIPANNKRRVTETAALLAILYESIGQPEKAAGWKQKSAALAPPASGPEAAR